MAEGPGCPDSCQCDSSDPRGPTRSHLVSFRSTDTCWCRRETVPKELESNGDPRERGMRAGNRGGLPRMPCAAALSGDGISVLGVPEDGELTKFLIWKIFNRLRGINQG